MSSCPSLNPYEQFSTRELEFKTIILVLSMLIDSSHLLANSFRQSSSFWELDWRDVTNYHVTSLITTWRQQKAWNMTPINYAGWNQDKNFGWKLKSLVSVKYHNIAVLGSLEEKEFPEIQGCQEVTTKYQQLQPFNNSRNSYQNCLPISDNIGVKLRFRENFENCHRLKRVWPECSI